LELGVLCGIDEIHAGGLVNGNPEGLFEGLTCCFRKPYVRVSGLDESECRGRKEGRLGVSTVSDGLDGDDDVTVYVLIECE
jgi:hypothetical protein